MELVVIECLACPVTGTFFTSVITEQNIWLIIWSEDGPLLQSGDTVELIGGKMFIRSEQVMSTIIVVKEFQSSLWKRLQSSTYCQGERKIRPQLCSEILRCNFKKCPYGLIRWNRS